MYRVNSDIPKLSDGSCKGEPFNETVVIDTAVIPLVRVGGTVAMSEKVTNSAVANVLIQRELQMCKDCEIALRVGSRRLHSCIPHLIKRSATQRGNTTNVEINVDVQAHIS